MMRLTRNTLSENVCAQTSEMLNRRLATEIHPYGQLKQAHRNVGGVSFIAVRELFDRVIREAESDSDLITERTAGLGAVAEGQSRSRPSELSLSCAPCRSPTKANAEALATFGQSAREAIGQSAAIGDADTADFFIKISRGVEDRLWFVESHAAPIRGNGSHRKDPAGNPDDSTKIATAPIAADTVSTRWGADAVGSRSLDNVAVWVNEGGSGGEVIR